MGDPGLKLPLSSRPSVMLAEKHRWVVVDADNIPLQLTKHQGEVIVAALTAGADTDRPSAARLADIRPCVLHFAVEMERKLKANDWKEHWSNFSVEYLVERAAEELAELEHAIDALLDAEGTGKGLGRLALRVAEEAVDLANFAMMIGDMIDNMEPDAENQARFAACDYHHGPEVTVCTKCGWTPDAEKEVQGG